jgi:GNAT superfamily N-acetyltransferase
MTEPYRAWRRDGFVISTDPAATDLDQVCNFLATTYWAKGLPRHVVEGSIRAALVYNLIDEANGRQAGFARVVSDLTRFAWLSDVFVLEAYRGKGLGGWLVQTVLDDSRLALVGRFLLATADAHRLYRRLGWEDVRPGRYMAFERPKA